MEPDIAVRAEDAHRAALTALISSIGDEQEGACAALAEEARNALAEMAGQVLF